MVEVKINARVRPSKTSAYKHTLRERGLIPAVVYGKGVTSQPIELDVKDLETAIRTKGRNALIDLVLKGKKGDNKCVVMVKEVQRDPIRREIVHADLYSISLRDKIHTAVPVILKGEAKGLINGGIVQSAVREIEVLCMPADIPEAIQLDISSLDIGDHFAVADIPHNDNIKILTEPETIVVTVVAPRVTEEPVTTGAAAPAAPVKIEHGNGEQEGE